MNNTSILNYFHTIPQITAMELKKAIDGKKRFVLLDVRTQEEFQRGRIARSINIPVDELHESVLGLIPDKKRLVYIYCLSGSRSSVAVNTMIKMGYTNVFEVKSGLLAWRTKEFPIEQ